MAFNLIESNTDSTSLRNDEFVGIVFSDHLRELAGNLGASDIEFIIDYLTETQPILRRHAKKELAEILECDPKRIDAIWNSREDIAAELDFDLSGSASGAHVNYDTNIKKKWRAEWREFLEKNLPVEGRDRMKVICLPSKDPKREVTIYTDLGILPENIHAVEGNPSVRTEFEKNCYDLGVKPLFGRLEKIISTLTEPYSIVSYDFLGPACSQYYDILAATPIDLNAIFLINVRSAREKKGIQNTLQYFFEDIAENTARLEYNKASKQKIILENLFNVRLPELESPQLTEASLSELRNVVRDNAFCATLGATYRNSFNPKSFSSTYDKLFSTFERALKGHEEIENDPELRNKFVERMISLMRPTVARYVARALDSNKIQSPADYMSWDRVVEGLISQTFSRVPEIKDVQKVRYFSEVSSLRAPYDSIFAHITCAPIKIREQRDRLTSFLLKAAEIVCDYLAEHRDVLRDAPIPILKCGIAFKNSNALTNQNAEVSKLDFCILKDGKIKARMPLSEMIRIFEEYGKGLVNSREGSSKVVNNKAKILTSD